MFKLKKILFKNTLFVCSLTIFIFSYCFFFSAMLNSSQTDKTVSAAISADNKACIIIDPGHGGEDGGAVGLNGVLEKDLNLLLSKNLETILRFAGYEVILTRTDDKLLYDVNSDYKGRKKILDLQGRLEIAESIDPDIFIGIHMNSFPESKYSGLSVYYSDNNVSSHEAGELIRTNVKNNLQPQNNREIKSAGSNIYILNRITCPAILIECGFVSNPDECELLSTPEYRKMLSYIFYSSAVSFLKK